MPADSQGVLSAASARPDPSSQISSPTVKPATPGIRELRKQPGSVVVDVQVLWEFLSFFSVISRSSYEEQYETRRQAERKVGRRGGHPLDRPPRGTRQAAGRSRDQGGHPLGWQPASPPGRETPCGPPEHQGRGQGADAPRLAPDADREGRQGVTALAGPHLPARPGDPRPEEAGA